MRAAHPRSRGENTAHTDGGVDEGGSSPLTRGKPSDRREHSGDNGLIPAHAGKTSRSRRDGKSWRAHPRSRGENGTRSDLAYVTEGSSPLTRGKRGARDHRRGQAGLIPAHAGKTKPSAYQTARCTAHPRSRGENVFQVMRIWPRSGSSPLTRGKLAVGVFRWFLAGLIPAHAGKTAHGLSPRLVDWAHPRSRGENTVCSFTPGMSGGSSPLTRGKRFSARSSSDASGLIPAHAGKTRPISGA